MGFSVGSSLLPMASVPPGRSTISGHCKHSRKGSYGLSARVGIGATAAARLICPGRVAGGSAGLSGGATAAEARSEEHTSELQSLRHLVCRLLLEKKKKRRPY